MTQEKRCGHAETQAIGPGDMLDLVREDSPREAQGLPRTVVRDIPVPEDEDEDEAAPDSFRDDGDFEDDDDLGEGRLPPDVASTSSTSAPVRNRRAAADRGRKR